MPILNCTGTEMLLSLNNEAKLLLLCRPVKVKADETQLSEDVRYFPSANNIAIWQRHQRRSWRKVV